MAGLSWTYTTNYYYSSEVKMIDFTNNKGEGKTSKVDHLELVLIGKIWYNRDMKKEYKRTNYPSDLMDRQWEKIEEFFPSGNKSKYHKRNLV
jgi:hypothetical protein